MPETERNTHPGTGRHKPGIWSSLRGWWAGLGAQDQPDDQDAPAPAWPFDVHEALHLLPSILDAKALPNGVVELVIEDPHAPGRCVIDIHDGSVSHVEPGTIVPWASIAGSHGAWAMALAAGEAAGLRLTGEKQLARRVLAALPRPAIDIRALEQGATA